MSDLADWLDHERALARRLGVFATEASYQTLTCPECDEPRLVKRRLDPLARGSLQSVQEGLIAIAIDLDSPCPSCDRRPERAPDSETLYLAFSPRLGGHLGVEIHVSTTDDGRLRVRRALWLARLDADELEELDPADPRLDSVDRDAELRRCAAQAEADAPDDADAALRALAELLSTAGEDATLLRELARLAADRGLDAVAARYLERALAAGPATSAALIDLAGLYRRLDDDAAASETLARAFEASGDVDLLPDLVVTAARARRLGATERAAQALQITEPDSVVAAKALVGTAAIVAPLVDALDTLERHAANAGDLTAAAVATHWLDVLALPLPDWSAAQDRAGYLEALADELRPCGTVDTAPQPLVTPAGAAIAGDLLFEDDTGRRFRFFVVDQLPTRALHQTLAATARAARALGDDAVIVPLARQPLPYATLALLAGTPRSALLLDADADCTMVLADVNAEAFADAAQTYFGRPLDFTTESLADVAAILDALRDDGVGDPPYPLLLLAASYVGSVAARTLGEPARWVDGPDGRGAPVLEVGDTELDIIPAVVRAARIDADAELNALVQLLNARLP
ncbi:MAG: hypothetical protein H6698_08880 [Myxococcales bacterium]|nr:hypothetical protein [Myxococcales bacterium]MCB9534399.1 hypothetical protein [Myxococcales bacterium]